MAKIRYEKILQRQGSRSELPTLDSGEFGFTTDTAQLFIGTNPQDSKYINENVISIDAFPNAQQEIASLLSQNVDYQDYEVSDGLLIETESNEKALEIIEFINTGRDIPVARLERNIELITSENVNDYIHPSDFNATYDPQTSLRPSRSLLTKVLKSSDAGVFLEFDFKQVFHLSVKYTLVQNNGWHRRSGVITLLGDNSTSGDGQEYIGFDDEQTLMSSDISKEFIKFDAAVDPVNKKIRVLFEYPKPDADAYAFEHETKIYYRIERWNVAGVMEAPYIDMYEEPVEVLGVEDGVLGLYVDDDDDDGVLGINRGND